MCSDKNVLKVRIYGAEYPVRGYADANYIKKVADYVDQKMRDVDKNIRVDSSLRVAILASLNIADELFKEQKQNALLRQQLEDKIVKLNALIDRKLSIHTDKSDSTE